MPIFPRPVAKRAVLVPIPRTLGDNLLPTFIWAEWNDVQVFHGDYYLIVNDDGVGIYGSAQEQWEHMHTRLGGILWVKTAIPLAYQATEVCDIITLIPEEDGSIREARHTLQPGDWIVRQPGGEVQHILAAKFGGIYFSYAEAQQLGLTRMTQEQFAGWAVAQARAALIS